jgi:hypothetical protein
MPQVQIKIIVSESVPEFETKLNNANCSQISLALGQLEIVKSKLIVELVKLSEFKIREEVQ